MAWDSIDATETPPPTTVRTARDAAERASSFVQQRVTEAFDRAHDLIREADGWVGDVRDFVRSHPLQALAATIGIGFIFDKLLRRR
jgi:ElaB/YqjD/DUF883 family membrane-anchored ribosome-binding protein